MLIKITTTYYFHRLHLLVYQNSLHLKIFERVVDESYFGGQRKGTHSRDSIGKVAVFGILKRNGKVYTVTITNTKTVTLFPIIREQVKPDSFVIRIITTVMMY